MSHNSRDEIEGFHLLFGYIIWKENFTLTLNTDITNYFGYIHISLHILRSYRLILPQITFFENQEAISQATVAVKIIQPAIKQNFIHLFFWNNTCCWALTFTTW